MKDVGTLKELGVQAGDVVDNQISKELYDIILAKQGVKHERINLCDFGKLYALSRDGASHQSVDESFLPNWRIISRATSEPKLWRDMTAEEKGALLLAAHEDWRCIEVFKDDEWYTCGRSTWKPDIAYRVKPEPKVETVEFTGHIDAGIFFRGLNSVKPQVKITFTTIDGKPDCASVKMGAIE